MMPLIIMFFGPLAHHIISEEISMKSINRGKSLFMATALVCIAMLSGCQIHVRDGQGRMKTFNPNAHANLAPITKDDKGRCQIEGFSPTYSGIFLRNPDNFGAFLKDVLVTSMGLADVEPYYIETYYVGQCKGDVPQGHGKIYNRKKKILYAEGNFVDGKITGHGTLNMDKAYTLRYETEMKDGLMVDGAQATLTLLDENDKLISSSKGKFCRVAMGRKNDYTYFPKGAKFNRYAGGSGYLWEGFCDKNGTPNGLGAILTQIKITKYSVVPMAMGQFSNNFADFKGVIFVGVDPVEKIYAGQIKNNEFNGKGLLFINDKNATSQRQYEGTFKNGKFVKGKEYRLLEEDKPAYLHYDGTFDEKGNYVNGKLYDSKTGKVVYSGKFTNGMTPQEYADSKDPVKRRQNDSPGKQLAKLFFNWMFGGYTSAPKPLSPISFPYEAHIVGQDGTYYGCLNCNSSDIKAVCRKGGLYGLNGSQKNIWRYDFIEKYDTISLWSSNAKYPPSLRAGNKDNSSGYGYMSANSSVKNLNYELHKRIVRALSETGGFRPEGLYENFCNYIILQPKL